MTWQVRINAALEERRAAEAFRVRRVVENGAGRFLTREGRQFCNFSSNDYLGLSQHPAIIRAWQQGAERFGVGSGGSGHVSGYTTAHQALEEELGRLAGLPACAAVYLRLCRQSGGHHGHDGERGPHCRRPFKPRLVAGSGNLSPAQLRRFAHNDASQLASLLDKPCDGQQLAVTEGVFSMDGDSAPLAALHEAAKRQKAWLLVDDAHGTGGWAMKDAAAPINKT